MRMPAMRPSNPSAPGPRPQGLLSAAKRALGRATPPPKALVILLALSALSLSSLAMARAPLPSKEQRLSLLSLLNRHHYNVDRKALDRIGPAKAIVDHLVHFAGDPELRPKVRTRAIASLRVYPSPRIQKVLEGLLYDPTLKTREGVLLIREAMRSLGLAFGQGAVVALSNHRDDPNPQIREGCAHGLGLTGSKGALTILDAWLPHEPELFVRLAVDKAIAHIRGRTSP